MVGTPKGFESRTYRIFLRGRICHRADEHGNLVGEEEPKRLDSLWELLTVQPAKGRAFIHRACQTAILEQDISEVSMKPSPFTRAFSETTDKGMNSCLRLQLRCYRTL